MQSLPPSDCPRDDLSSPGFVTLPISAGAGCCCWSFLAAPCLSPPDSSSSSGLGCSASPQHAAGFWRPLRVCRSNPGDTTVSSWTRLFRESLPFSRPLTYFFASAQSFSLFSDRRSNSDNRDWSSSFLELRHQDPSGDLDSWPAAARIPSLAFSNCPCASFCWLVTELRSWRFHVAYPSIEIVIL